MAAPLLNRRVANVFLRLCDDTSVTPALRNAALSAFGKINPRWMRFDKHFGLRKRVLESSWLRDTIRVIESECYGLDGEPKDSVDQHNGRTIVYDQGAYQNLVTCQ